MQYISWSLAIFDCVFVEDALQKYVQEHLFAIFCKNVSAPFTAPVVITCVSTNNFVSFFWDDVKLLHHFEKLFAAKSKALASTV